ncbi:hypothetical protein HMPREF5505_0766, partial [Lactobacillus delbrueckii subsp. lactis DSM 20072]
VFIVLFGVGSLSQLHNVDLLVGNQYDRQNAENCNKDKGDLFVLVELSALFTDAWVINDQAWDVTQGNSQD